MRKVKENNLGTENFLKQSTNSEDAAINKNYLNEPTCFEDSKGCYLKQHKHLSQEEKDKIAAKKKHGADDKEGKAGDDVVAFMDTEGKDAKVEALICIWKIDKGG